MEWGYQKWSKKKGTQQKSSKTEMPGSLSLETIQHMQAWKKTIMHFFSF